MASLNDEVRCSSGATLDETVASYTKYSKSIGHLDMEMNWPGLGILLGHQFILTVFYANLIVGTEGIWLFATPHSREILLAPWRSSTITGSVPWRPPGRGYPTQSSDPATTFPSNSRRLRPLLFTPIVRFASHSKCIG